MNDVQVLLSLLYTYKYLEFIQLIVCIIIDFLKMEKTLGNLCDAYQNET